MNQAINESNTQAKRIHSIDFLRGLVIIIMTLDHVRDLLHTASLVFQPTDLTKTTPALFFTRWVTHLCAPTFVFLSGASAFLSMKRSSNVPAFRKFLLKRGLVLILLDFTLINFGMFFDAKFRVLLFNVIAAIGFAMIVLSFLLNRSLKTIAAIGLLILALHNLAPLVPLSETSLIKKVLMPFFAPGAFPLLHDRLFVVGYPPIPWLGIMLVGFASGSFFLREEERQQPIFLKLGVFAVGLFLVLRLLNVYGDSVSWSQQQNNLFSLLSFINLTKYPPSLQFCLLFLGIMFLILWATCRTQNRWTRTASVFGKVPLFFFVVHWYIIHPAMFLMVFLQGFGSTDMVFGFNFGRPASGSGIELWAVYLVWIAIVAVMYPLCKWYGRYKITHKEKRWLRYL